MSLRYREAFKVNNSLYGIEDYQDGKDDHFMPDKAKHRFALWARGCGIGKSDTIEDARRLLHAYIVSSLRAESAGFKERALHVDMALSKLGDDFWGLAKFQQSFEKQE